jgi:hypothetical protein
MMIATAMPNVWRMYVLGAGPLTAPTLHRVAVHVS